MHPSLFAGEVALRQLGNLLGCLVDMKLLLDFVLGLSNSSHIVFGNFERPDSIASIILKRKPFDVQHNITRQYCGRPTTHWGGRPGLPPAGLHNRCHRRIPWGPRPLSDNIGRRGPPRLPTLKARCPALGLHLQQTTRDRRHCAGAALHSRSLQFRRYASRKIITRTRIWVELDLVCSPNRSQSAKSLSSKLVSERFLGRTQRQSEVPTQVELGHVLEEQKADAEDRDDADARKPPVQGGQTLPTHVRPGRPEQVLCRDQRLVRVLGEWAPTGTLTPIVARCTLLGLPRGGRHQGAHGESRFRCTAWWRPRAQSDHLRTSSPIQWLPKKALIGKSDWLAPRSTGPSPLRWFEQPGTFHKPALKWHKSSTSCEAQPSRNLPQLWASYLSPNTLILQFCLFHFSEVNLHFFVSNDNNVRSEVVAFIVMWPSKWIIGRINCVVLIVSS